jgi:ABC-type lipoprotein export system ATPase subunit
MKTGGSNAQRLAIVEFLFAFDDDPVQAVRALREYIHNDTAALRANSNSTAPVLLRVNNLTKQYKLGRQKLDVLKGVTLDIRKGEFVAITGASGSGKSTLLQLMGGLDKPTGGDITFDGVSLAKLSDGKLSAFRRDTVGFVFQFFYLQPFLKLQQNLEVPGMFARTTRRKRHEIARGLADKVGLSDRITHYPKELSGGQMQRAAIARALLNNPKILLADEPTGNLDSKNGRAIIDVFEAVRSELGTTIILVTHDPVIARRADREIRLKDGVVV